jgi:hypothetical protein
MDPSEPETSCTYTDTYKMIVKSILRTLGGPGVHCWRLHSVWKRRNSLQSVDESSGLKNDLSPLLFDIDACIKSLFVITGKYGNQTFGTHPYNYCPYAVTAVEFEKIHLEGLHSGFKI